MQIFTLFLCLLSFTVLAKQFTVKALRSGKVIELQNIQRGKYFRLLADVYIDGNSLAKGLIASGHARPYNGGKRLGWCGK